VKRRVPIHCGSATGPGIRHLIGGAVTPAQAVKEDMVTILKGNLKLLERWEAAAP
jgi:hypothetical protein